MVTQTDNLSDQLIDEMKELIKAEDATLFTQGDKLVDAHLTDGALAKLAEVLQRSVRTLKQRENVSRQVPKHRRDSRHSWTIYAEAVRITDETERWRILDSRSEWSVTAMKLAAQAWVEQKARAEGNRSPRLKNYIYKSGTRCGNVKATLVQTADDTLIITIDGPNDLGEPRILPLSKGSVQIVFDL